VKQTPADLESEFPDFYRSSDAGSLDGQKRYVNATRTQLIALVIAAVAGAFTWKLAGNSLDLAGVVAVSAFLVALLVRASTWKSRPERDWYAGRAAAESAKTLGWRFSIAAEPFPKSLSVNAATDILLERLAEVGRSLRGVVILPPPNAKGEVTPRMIEVRQDDLSVRKAIYLVERIGRQRDWYAKKARANITLSRTWMSIMLVLEAAGAIGGVLKASGIVEIDILGLLGALVAAILAWTEMRQNANLSSAYSVAAAELSSVLTRGKRAMSEAEWALFAANAEEAISREHTMWAASRDA
jgi:hypothetical protein